MAVRKTGLQKQVLALYKRSLQLVQSKPLEHRPSWFLFIAHHFRDPSLGGGLRRRDVSGVEYMLRKGDKMLEQYKGSGTRKVELPQGSGRWPLGWVARGGKEGLGRG